MPQGAHRPTERLVRGGPLGTVVPEDRKPLRRTRGGRRVLVRTPGVVIGAGAEAFSGRRADVIAFDEMEEWRQDGRAGADEAGVVFEGGIEHDGDEVPGDVGLGERGHGYGAGDADCRRAAFFCADGQPYGWGMGNS